MKKILIIKLSALGDLVQADGAMRDIRNHHHRDEITVMTIPSYQGYMERCPWVDRVFLDTRDSRFRVDKMISLRNRLKKEHFDLVYDLQQVGRTMFYFSYLFRNVDWIGGAKKGLVYNPRPDDRCAADHFALTLKQCGVEVSHTIAPDIAWLADGVEEVVARYQLDQPYVLLIPGASSGQDKKRWPYFKDLARFLSGMGYRVITVPGPDEMEVCRELDADMLVNADGSYLNFYKLAGIARRCQYVVGNDTGPTHIAAHLNVPGLALFNNRIPATYTGIQHTRFSWLQVDELANLSLENVRDRVLSDLQG